MTGPRGPGVQSTLMPGLRRPGEREAVGESRRRLPERGRPSVSAEESLRRCGVVGDNRRCEPRGFGVRDPDCLVEVVDEVDGDRRDAIRVVRPFVSEPSRRAGRRPRACLARLGCAHVEAEPAEELDEVGQEADRTAIDEAEVEPVADAEPVEARLDDRQESLAAISAPWT